MKLHKDVVTKSRVKSKSKHTVSQLGSMQNHAIPGIGGKGNT